MFLPVIFLFIMLACSAARQFFKGNKDGIAIAYNWTDHETFIPSLCPRYEAVRNGTVKMEHALSGATIYFFVKPPDNISTPLISLDSESGFPKDGYIYQLIINLQEMLGFNAVFVQADPGTLSNTDYVAQAGRAIHFSAG